MRRLRCALLTILVSGTAATLAPAGEPRGEREPVAGGRPPLCRVEITPVEGIPSKGLLLSFEKGVYLVRVGSEDFKVSEMDVKSVTFLPLEKKKRRDDRLRSPPGRPTKPRRPDDKRLREMLRVQGELRRKLFDLKRTGKLAGHIAARASQLQSAGGTDEALRILFDLSASNRMNGTPLGPEGWGRLVRSIEDEAVRREVEGRWRQLMRAIGEGGRRGRARGRR